MSGPSTALDVIKSAYQRNFGYADRVASDNFQGELKKILYGAEGPINRYRARNGIPAISESITGTIYQVTQGNPVFAPPENSWSTYVIINDQKRMEYASADPIFDIKNFILDISTSNAIAYASRFANRLTYLFNESLSDGDEILSLGSLKYCWNFIRKIQVSAYPDVTLATSGNIRLGWGRSVKGRFNSEFFPDARIRYALIYKNHADDFKSNRISGEDTSDVVLKQLDATPCWSMIKNLSFD